MKLPSRVIPPSRSVRKIGLLGSHSASLVACPWTDPSWELWGHASSRPWYKREADFYFELHRRECWDAPGKKVSRYPEWLASNPVPIYMWKKHPEVPASRVYPKERILIEYGGVRRYFKNQLSWMIALAFSEGVTHLGLFGVSYQTEQERQCQRGSAEYWLGRAEERGIHLVLPDACGLLAEPAGLYGYESHDDVVGLIRRYPRLFPCFYLYQSETLTQKYDLLREMGLAPENIWDLWEQAKGPVPVRDGDT